MSSRPQLQPFKVITNGSMAGSLTSTPTIISDLSMASYDIAWTSGSTPVGIITVQVSNTYVQNPDGTTKVAGNWTTLDFGEDFNVSGNTGNGFLDIDATAGYAIRLVYTRTSGSGTLNVTVKCKVA